MQDAVYKEVKVLSLAGFERLVSLVLLSGMLDIVLCCTMISRAQKHGSTT